MTQVIEFWEASGLTLTLSLFPVDVDTATDTGVACVEATNRKGLYQATVPVARSGVHDAVVFEGSTPAGGYQVTLPGVAGAIVRVREPANTVALAGQAVVATTAFNADRLDAAITSRSTLNSTDAALAVWASPARTLTGFGTLVADIWAAFPATITTLLNSVLTNTNRIPSQPAAVGSLMAIAEQATDDIAEAVEQRIGNDADDEPTLSRILVALSPRFAALEAAIAAIPAGGGTGGGVTPASGPQTGLAAAASAPLTVTVDGQTVTQHSLKDQIAAAEFLAGQAVAKAPAKALRFATVTSPGAQ